jgi:hypothetical protein
MRRVVVWGTGNMGSTAIRSALAFPGLRLVGVVTSSDEKAGRDAATFAGLDAETGVIATTDVDAAISQCDAVAYMSSGDIRPDEAVNDIERCLCAGAHVVTPSLYSLYDPRSAPRDWVDRLTAAAEEGGNTTAANRLLGAVEWLATQKPGIYDGLDVPLHTPLPDAAAAARWAD